MEREPGSPLSPTAAMLERTARLSDESIGAQLQQLLDRLHFQIMTSSMGRSWNRLKVLEGFLHILAYCGVALTDKETARLPQLEEEHMIAYIVEKMDESVRESLETSTDAVLALIASVCQIRSVLDSASEEDIYQFLSADETQICEQVLKYAVLVTSNEVAHLHKCQDTWVGNMETRLDRLMRAAEIAEAAQQQLLVVEAQLAGLGGQQKGKVKKVLGHFACASSRSLACAALAAWRGLLEQTKADKALRDMYEEQLADAERHLLRMKASCKALAKDNVDHMAKAREQVLLQQWLLLWQSEAVALKSDRVAQEQVQQVLGRVYTTAKKQASHTTHVMTRQAREQQAALLGETWALWLCFVSDCRKERLFEQDVKHFELRMKEHLRQKTQEARMIFDRVGAATRTGLLASILWAWQCSVIEGRKLQSIQNQVTEASQEVDGLKMRQSTAICNVQMRSEKLMDSSLVISVISAWSRETKENHLEKFYSNKVDSKRKQLTAVQTLFKSFARDLEEGLKQVDGDSSGRESTRRSRSKQGITSTN